MGGATGHGAGEKQKGRVSRHGERAAGVWGERVGRGGAEREEEEASQVREAPPGHGDGGGYW